MATNPKTPRKLNPPPNNATISKVRVIVRVRPFLPQEISSNSQNPSPCVSARFDSDNDVTIFLKDPDSSRSESYKLDAYYGEEDNRLKKIFENEVKRFVPGVFDGCNATVFAYGATGSGKTYTMQGTDEQPGLMPLAMSTILSMCKATGNIAEVSYYEVYLDRCYDLLEPKAKEISVLDDKDGQIHLRGLSRVSINSMSEFQEVFTCGVQRRKVAHTGLNDVSSRSHGILVITVSKSANNGSETMIIGKLNLIDLAGNEDNKRSGNEGIRMQESAKINQSLFALSNLIYALNSNKSWIPYRESKLTRILQDSLGGTSHALMVACLNPSDYYESVHTVSLAARSRHISNVVPSAQKQETPKVKIDMEAKLQSWRESKGKTKSVQRSGAFGSRFVVKTPGSMSSLKKPTENQSLVKASAGNSTVKKDRLLSLPQRKLFYSDAPHSSSNEGLEDVRECLPNTNDFTLVEDEHRSNSPIVDVKSRHSSEVVHELAVKDTIDGTQVKARASSHDELVEEDNTEINRDSNFLQTPQNKSKSKGCQSPNPFREALSPININITTSIDAISPRDTNSLKTPFVATRERRFADFDTPLDKFNARSSNMKSFLVEEYMDFLNTATRDELVRIKGIGVKRAEYIIELRETTPLKSLSDLEKIGLSYKQVQHMFSKAAKGIFETFE